MENENEIINRLFEEWLHSKHLLIEFEKLFSEDNLLIEVRENYLFDFYLTMSDLFWNYFLINIAKLLDPSSQGNFKNLSLFALVDILKNINKLGIAEELNQSLLILKSKNQDVIKYRKKNLAHLDLDYSTGKEVFNSSTTIQELYSFYDEVLQLINFTLNELSLPPKSDVIINPGKYKGANELNRILLEYNDYSISKLKIS